MFNAQVAGYTGKQLENGFVEIVNDGTCYLLLSVEESGHEVNGRKIIEDIKDQILHAQIIDLASFENILSSQIFKQNLPAHFSLAAGYLHEDSLFIKTVGNGQVYFRRGKDFALLLSGDKSAAGPVQEYDCAIFTIDRIQQVLGDANDIQLFVDMNAPKDIVEKLQNEEYDEEDRGFAAVFAEFTTQAGVSAAPATLGINPFADPISEKHPVTAPTAQAASNTTLEPTTEPANPNVSPQKSFPKFNLGGSKKIALILAVVLFGILLWSVVFGYERRAAARFEKKVEETAISVESKLAKAEKEAFLNLDISMELISQAKEELSELKSESEGRNESKIGEIEKKIVEMESTIVKKEEKDYTEFYDLGLEDKDAQGVSLNREGNLVAILDPKNKTVYSLSVDKKSLDKYTAAELVDATLVSLYDENIYFFSKKGGIFQFTSENNVKNIVKADRDWGSIVDFEIFNGNLYLLDKANNEVYKYVPTEDGYSEKSSYFTSGSVDIETATGMSIDASVYISTADTVKKFTRGAAEAFETEFPEKTVSLAGIYTDADIEQVYTWDREKAVIYVLEKDGGYLRQLQSSILKNASGIFVTGDSVYVLADRKVYAITLD